MNNGTKESRASGQHFSNWISVKSLLKIVFIFQVDLNFIVVITIFS